MNLKLKPGDKINDSFIKENLQVSRTPIREGIIRLVSEGLVTIVPQVSSSVSKISIKNIQDDTFVRNAIEEKIFDSAIDIITKEQLEEAYDILEQQQKTVETNDIFKHLELDNAFHYIFIEAVGNVSALNLLKTINERNHRARLLYIQNSPNIKKMNDEHWQLIKCMEEKDKDKLRFLLNQHIFSFLNNIEKIKELYPHFIDE